MTSTTTETEALAALNKGAAELQDRDLDAALARGDFSAVFDALDGIAEAAESIEDETRAELAETLRDVVDDLMVAIADGVR